MTTETSNARGEWVLVPRVPTDEMVMAGGYLHPDQHGDAGVVYSAMLSVAPSAESDAARYIAELEAAIASAGMDVCESAESDGPFPLILVWTGSGNTPSAPPPAAARGDVRGLAAKWREEADGCQQAGYEIDWLLEAEIQTLRACADELESVLAAEGVQAGEVYVDFPQVGIAGPFLVEGGKVTLPDVTMNDLIQHARTGYVLQKPEARGAAVPAGCRDRLLAALERAAAAESALRALVDECANDIAAGWEERMNARIADANRLLAALSQQPEARGVVDDSALEALIGDAEGESWCDDEFRIESRGLMKLLRDAAALTGERNG